MKELQEYRQKLLERLTTAADEFRRASLNIEDPYAEIEPGGWNVHQVAVHTRDVDRLVYGARARRTLGEDKPEFPNFDGDAYMLQHYDRNEPLAALLDGFVHNVDALVALLREMEPAGWSRESAHETQGSGLTLQTWVERGLDHIEEHLATIRKAANPA
jgi:DinB family protein